MGRFVPAVVAVVALAVSASPAGALADGADPCGIEATSAPAASPQEAAAATVCLINLRRVASGRRPLVWRAELARTARDYSADMIARRFFAHETPDGVGLRARAARYVQDDPIWRVGEVLAWGTDQRATPAGVVDAWLASSPHRRILLDPRYRDLGVGVVAGTPFGDLVAGNGATYTAELGTRSDDRRAVVVIPSIDSRSARLPADLGRR